MTRCVGTPLRHFYLAQLLLRPQFVFVCMLTYPPVADSWYTLSTNLGGNYLWGDCLRLTDYDSVRAMLEDPALLVYLDNDDLGDLLSFTLGLDVNEENLSLRLALCQRSIDPSGDGLYPFRLPTFARVVHTLLDQSSRPPICVPEGL